MSIKLSELKALLQDHPGDGLRLSLPDGRAVPPDFHVTEVGHVTKQFIDCGGTVRSVEACVLQVWRADNDADHRLKAGKLGAILASAGAVVGSDDIEVEVEYEDPVITQYSVTSVDAAPGELRLNLAHKHTDCLAREACGLESSCCSGTECC